MIAFLSILVYSGLRLIDWKNLHHLLRSDRREASIFAAALAAVLFFDTTIGALVGLALAIFHLASTFAADFNLEVYHRTSPQRSTVIVLRGAITFLALPRLFDRLGDFKAEADVSFDLKDLYFVDYGGIEFLNDLARRIRAAGFKVELDQQALKGRAKGPKNMRQSVLQELQRVDRRSQPREESAGRRKIDRVLRSNPAEGSKERRKNRRAG